MGQRMRLPFKVSEAEYLAFLASYPHELERQFVGATDELELYHDRRLGTYPDSVVARACIRNEWPALGIQDPRPVEQRTSPWWREKCEVVRLADIDEVMREREAHTRAPSRRVVRRPTRAANVICAIVFTLLLGVVAWQLVTGL